MARRRSDFPFGFGGGRVGTRGVGGLDVVPGFDFDMRSYFSSPSSSSCDRRAAFAKMGLSQIPVRGWSMDFAGVHAVSGVL